jgi:hypothetical protein
LEFFPDYSKISLKKFGGKDKKLYLCSRFAQKTGQRKSSLIRLHDREVVQEAGLPHYANSVAESWV